MTSTDPPDGAQLARRLIESLEHADVGDVEAAWIEEAERRYSEYRKGQITTRPADEVFRKATDRVK